MEENLRKELIDSFEKSDHKDLVSIEFEGDVAICHNLLCPDITFIHVVNELAKAWHPIVDRHGWELVTFGVNNYGQRLADGRLKVAFRSKDAKVVKLAPDQRIESKAR